MNTIAMQIDYTTDVMRATNDLLEARANHRKLQNEGADIHKVIDAQVKVLKAELALADLIEPADYVAPEYSEDRQVSDETFPKAKRKSGLLPDDPRRGQAAGINRANRGN